VAVKNNTSLLSTSLALAGLCTIYVGQRILGPESGGTPVGYLGLFLFATAGGLRLRAWNAAQGDVRGVEARLLLGYAGMAVSVLLYALTTESGLQGLSLTGDAATRVPTVLSVLWVSLLFVSLCATLFMELVYVRMPIPASVELRRVRAASHAGLSLGLATVFLLSLNYVATARDVRKDVSYFRTTEPGDGTKSMIAKLDKPVHAILFFRTGSDVVAQVRPYFEKLAASSKKLTFEVSDVALAPELAQKHKVRDNGQVLLLRGQGEEQKGEFFKIGNELTEARGALRRLDGSFQATFNKLVRPSRTLYLTVGHGERNAKSSALPAAEGTSVMDEILRRLNLKTENLGLTQGLGNTVPEGASAVAIIGPTEPFLPEEANALLTYAQKGGKLFLMLEPGVDVGLAPLLTGLGIELLPGTVVSDTNHMRRAFNDSDRGIVFSNSYTSHPTVTTASRHQRELATVFVNGGALKGLTLTKEPKPKVTFPLRSAREFWRDLNGNFQRDGEEKNETLNLMAAVTLGEKGDGEGRAVVLGDGDFITNKLANNAGNMVLFVDTLAWLVGNEDLTGEVATEEDIAIEHSREQDKVWFYATTFGMPAPILVLGLWIGRRRRRRAEAKS
jgi:hypothetical protein